MAETPADIGGLAKQISAWQVQSPSDIQRLSELCRFLCVEAAALIGYAEFEIYEALRYADHGDTKRAKQVVRPLKHAISLQLLAARRCTAVHKTFRKLFAEQIASKMRPRGTRNFNWQQN